ncbi:aminoacyl-tRNA hydrolase, partial [bacterium]|nr:aminoacyl-tRNA hydrolase [bacterium]
MRIFVGLGNPGTECKDTRHNAGFMVIDNFLRKVESSKEKKYRYFISFCAEVDGNEAILVKPRVYINESGIAVRKVLDTFKVKPEDLVIIHDDLGIKTGKIKITFNKGD